MTNRMYLQSDNGGNGILIQDIENRKWYYWDESQLPVFLNGSDDENVAAIKAAIASGDMYDSEDWFNEFSDDELSEHYISEYDGMSLNEIDSMENYETDIYSGDRRPLGHDETHWIEI